MHNLSLRDSQVFGTLTLTGLCLGGIALYGLLRRPASPDELERKRRDMLVRQGRIVDGTVIDISDLDAEESGRPQGLQLILYQYEIAGVVYECSQDVTLLAHVVDIRDCRPGFPASVRYSPHNPGNSLIVAETWSGLRDTARSVPLHPTGAAAGTAPRKARIGPSAPEVGQETGQETEHETGHETGALAHHPADGSPKA